MWCNPYILGNNNIFGEKIILIFLKVPFRILGIPIIFLEVESSVKNSRTNLYHKFTMDTGCLMLFYRNLLKIKPYRLSSLNFPHLFPANFAVKRGGKMSEERRYLFNYYQLLNFYKEYTSKIHCILGSKQKNLSFTPQSSEPSLFWDLPRASYPFDPRTIFVNLFLMHCYL